MSIFQYFDYHHCPTGYLGIPNPVPYMYTSRTEPQAPFRHNEPTVMSSDHDKVVSKQPFLGDFRPWEREYDPSMQMEKSFEQYSKQIGAMGSQISQLNQKMQNISEELSQKILEAITASSRIEKEKTTATEVSVLPTLPLDPFPPESPPPTSLPQLQIGSTTNLAPNICTTTSTMNFVTKPVVNNQNPYSSYTDPRIHLPPTIYLPKTLGRPVTMPMPDPITTEISPQTVFLETCPPYSDPTSTSETVMTVASPLPPNSTSSCDQLSGVPAIQDYRVPFSGSDPYEFIRGYEEFFRMNPMTEVDMIQYVMQDFEGEALEWYYQYVEGKFLDTWTPDCWEDFVSELYGRFAGDCNDLTGHKGEDSIAHGVGDYTDFLSQIEASTPPIQQVWDHSIHDKVNSVLKNEFSSSSLTNNTVMGAYDAYQKESHVTNKELDEMLNRDKSCWSFHIAALSQYNDCLYVVINNPNQPMYNDSGGKTRTMHIKALTVGDGKSKFSYLQQTALSVLRTLPQTATTEGVTNWNQDSQAEAYKYVGGQTRIVSVKRDVSFNELVQKLVDSYGQNVIIKYQLPEESLDALVSISCSEDLKNMMDECEKLIERSLDESAKLRGYLFLASELDSSGVVQMGDFQDNWQRYVEAVNGIVDGAGGGIMRRESIASATSTQNSDLSGIEAIESTGHGQVDVIKPPSVGGLSPKINYASSQETAPKLPIAVVPLQQQHQMGFDLQQQQQMVFPRAHYLQSYADSQQETLNRTDCVQYSFQMGFSAQLLGIVGSMFTQQQYRDNTVNVTPHLFIPAVLGGYGWHPTPQPKQIAFFESLVPHQQVVLPEKLPRFKKCYMCQKAIPHTHSDTIAQCQKDSPTTTISNFNLVYYNLQLEENVGGRPINRAAVTSPVKEVIAENSQIIAQLLPDIMMKLAQTAELQIGSTYDRKKQADLQASLYGVLQVTIQKLSSALEMEAIILQAADQIMILFLMVFGGHSSTVHEEAMLDISALAEAPLFELKASGAALGSKAILETICHYHSIFCEPVEKTNLSLSFTAGLAQNDGLKKQPSSVYSMMKYATIVHGDAEMFMKFEEIWGQATGIISNVGICGTIVLSKILKKHELDLVYCATPLVFDPGGILEVLQPMKDISASLRNKKAHIKVKQYDLKK